jgi:hypothetical protein
MRRVANSFTDHGNGIESAPGTSQSKAVKDAAVEAYMLNTRYLNISL